MNSDDKRYSYDRFDSHGKRVGQACLDLLKAAPSVVTVEDALIEMGLEQGLRQTILDEFERTRGHYPDKYYILSITKHELAQFGLTNCFKTSVRSFVHPFTKEDVMCAHPNAHKTLYSVDAKHEEIRLVWSIPGYEECKSIMKNPSIYDPQLVQDVKDVMRAFKK